MAVRRLAEIRKRDLGESNAVLFIAHNKRNAEQVQSFDEARELQRWNVSINKEGSSL